MIEQKVTRHCFVCGVENPKGLHMHFYETDTTPVQVYTDYTVPQDYEGYPGVVHGGIISAMLDEVTYRTVLRGDPPRLTVTAKLSVRFRKPVPIETPLRIVGRVLQDRGKVVTVAGEVLGPDQVVLAECEATLVEVDSAFFEQYNLDPGRWDLVPGTEG